MLAYTFYESDNRVRRYAETLAQEGCQVDVIALRRNKEQAKKERIKDVMVYRVQDRVKNEKFKLSYLIRLLKFFYTSFVFLTKRHLSERYDLIHVHSVPDFEVYAALVPKLTGAKIILDIHDIVPEFYSCKFKTSEQSLIYKCLLLVERLSIAFSDHVVISNHIWEKRLISRSTRQEKCTTIMNYPDECIFGNCESHRNEKKLILIYPGTLNWHQGLDIAVEAFERIKDRAPQAEFHIYGDGPAKDNLESMVKKYHLEKRVMLKGAVPIDEMAKLIACADLGIVPKRNDSFGGEAFSTKTLEFMQLGVPIILSKTKVDDFYFDDSIVKFFTPENPEDLADAMLELIENEQYRRELAINAYRFVSNHRWGIKKDIYLNLVNDLMGTAEEHKKHLGLNVT